MPLTPADIHNREFRKASLGRRGYDEEQVDSLLDEVTLEMIKLLEENAALQSQGGAATASPAETQVITNGVMAELSAATAQLQGLSRACDQAEQKARALQRRLEEARQARAAAPAPSRSTATTTARACWRWPSGPPTTT
ncbi:DivIVA domain-containing protein [Paractinoplanes durhamensis]|uniref:DivIVA domain-containing protein n=1 Tax=Paractinoplanes durhamensis TaxID=113563 RepID=UPI003643A2B4